MDKYFDEAQRKIIVSGHDQVSDYAISIAREIYAEAQALKPNLETENERLNAENEKWRQQVDKLRAVGAVIMPDELTAENGAKGVFTGEFHEEIDIHCPDCHGSESEEGECDICDGDGMYSQSVQIGWSTIKEIYSMAVEKFGIKL